MSEEEIWVVPFFGQGHLFPSMELCKQIASRNFKTVLVIPSNLSSSVPSSLRQYPLVQIAQIQSTPPLPQLGPDPIHHPPPPGHNDQLVLGLENLLQAQNTSPDSARPICAILDVMMDWTAEIFSKFDVPTVGFLTSGACSAAMEYAIWKAHDVDLKPGEIRLLPGLPKEMALTYLDTKRRPHGPPGPPPPQHGGGQLGPSIGGPPPSIPPPFDGPAQRKGGPHKPGSPPPLVNGVEGSIALMINTCDDLERPFIQYLTNQMGKPVWGVGPLLPEQYWKSIGSVLHDREIRTNRQSNVTEEEVIQWLDSRPRGSVLYVSFGTEVGPSMEEYSQLASALEALTQPFIWVIQPGSGRPGPPSSAPGNTEEGYFPHGLASQVGPRGLIIRGWAPQLLILSHPSTGGFLSHCGWNSTVEAIGRGVPLLGWPIRGDQNYNVKLVVAHLKVGYMVCDDLSEKIKKEDIIRGIETLMGDADVKRRALVLSAKFQNGFPISSVAALDAFRDLLNQRAA
ncbi:UDP-glucuronosyl/UDP-glucosyltransferase [Parasponia andersonii]|uniref:Glycosyltransferase n=1 Tax=Parasponia andersonii TaxID=3476 RepID=A0A2P5B7N5_PARAD|nr:UDP-glucuronosyl/UDP-glucosyltransferase [Parasponia andersonii]